MSFDRETGQLWLGDVGQDAVEEIDLIVRGGNYGWAWREGSKPFRGTPPRPTELVDPVAQYGHEDGRSITGGYVYRGTAHPALTGAYIYGDFAAGHIWALRFSEGRQLGTRMLVRDGCNMSSFAEDGNGELYVVCFDGYIRQLAPVDG